MKLAPEWLTASAPQRVADMFRRAGYQAYFVGGCVRNTLLGAPVTDLDLSTDALPDRVLALAKAEGIKAVPTGIDHGTVTLIIAGEPFEVTTFRKDVETDGRRAVVAFAECLEEDAQRRDFTMNALYMDAQGQVTDPTGGLTDLKARRFRFIGSAEARIREDYLRILRFFRFHAWYGVDLDADGLAACAAHHGGLAQLSAERVTSEMVKLLSAPDPCKALGAMQASGVLGSVLPGADLTFFLPFVHLSSGLLPDPMARLAALGGGMDQLRLSKKEAARREAYQHEMGSTHSAARLAYERGTELAQNVLALRAAMLGQPWQPDQDGLARGAAAVFPIRAADLPHLSGPALGQALKRLKAAWVASDLTASKAQLLETL